MGARFFDRTEPSANTTSNSATSRRRSTTTRCSKNVSFFVDHGETGVIMGRSGVGKSVSAEALLGFLQPEGADYCGRAGHDGLDGGAVVGDPPARDDGISIGRAVRFADGGGKYRVSRWKSASDDDRTSKKTRK